MSGYGFRLHDPLALVAALVAPFLVALALVPYRTDPPGARGPAGAARLPLRMRNPGLMGGRWLAP